MPIENQEDQEIDPVENMLRKTGCIELHYKVQECIAAKQDWRQCQNEVKEFKICMDSFTNKKKTN